MTRCHRWGPGAGVRFHAAVIVAIVVVVGCCGHRGCVAAVIAAVVAACCHGHCDAALILMVIVDIVVQSSLVLPRSLRLSRLL
jgi:hypothetical protein